MSTTTQILFNSPALHSLKREQLVKLCKIHSIKASGKNVELIQKLRLHAQKLPKDSPLSIAARSEEHGPIPIQVQLPELQEQESEQETRDDASYQNARSRPSEQWEMVMDSIEELEEESSQGTLKSQRTLGHNGVAGEFGTGGSKSTTVSSSIKAIATSLGLKKGNSKSTTASTSSMRIAAFSPQAVQEATDELSQRSTPYSSLPESTSLPQTDHFTLDNTRMSIDGNTDIPLPGHVLRPGIPAPDNARLSMGTGAPSTPSRPTTTIRLISNPLSHPGPSVDHSYASGENGTPQLKPFKTSFDITFGSPAPNGSGFNFGSLNTWPPRSEDDVQMKGIYPTLSFEDLPPSLEMKPPGTPAKAGDVTVHESLALPRSPDVFVFGTPHKVTDDQFRSAAVSVLEDLNRQLREDGVEEIENDIIAKLHPGSLKEPPRKIKPIPASKRGEITDKFQRLHEEEFHKMEGIDSLVKRRERLVPKKLPGDGEKPVLGKKRKSSALGSDGGLGSRRPSAITARRASNTRVISNGRRAKALPGAFDMDDDDDAEEQQEDRAGKRVKMDPESVLLPEEEAKKQEMAEQHRLELEKEKEAIRKKLEANRARRRSSAAHGGLSGRKSGRVSVGKPRQSILVKPKSKPAKFGFLSSAKSLVQSVWNRGKGPTPAVAGSSQIPKASTAAAKPEPAKEKMGPPSFVPTKKSSVAPQVSAAVASGSRGPSTRISDAKQKAEDAKSLSSVRGSIASSSRSRSPMPVAGSSRNSLQSNTGSRSRTSSILSPGSRMSSIAGTAASRSRSPTNVSSIGTRLSSATGMSSIGDVGSMGVRNVAGRKSVMSRSSAAGSNSSRFSNVSSRLFAPTASSLAKMARSPPSGTDGPNKQTLGSITNSPVVTASPNASGTLSPRPGGIFSKPLTLPPQSGIPTPVKRRLLNDQATTGAAGDGNSSKDQGKTTASSSTLVRTHSLNGRKPRISRSKVIARLASQRAAGGSGPRAAGVSALAPRASNVAAAVGGRVVSGGKTRSSIGAKVSRASYGGGTRSRPSVGASGGVVMSAKKRARQSEYARRRSKVGPLNFDGIAPKGVDVDMN
ncbi:hypothetical protein CVT25_008946 [Psilocybe cyanescens]|uniref:SAP domain-containing protein n=1 Tax=Psilocybe cyanescens TaxID=93625 RepID=A0A409XN14_PSICY|nr:hypothetical protein CVT25_008946 [Psilocybe cyanescens]